MADIQYLERVAAQTRRDIVRMVHRVASGHPGASLGTTEFFVRGHPPHLDVFLEDSNDGRGRRGGRLRLRDDSEQHDGPGSMTEGCLHLITLSQTSFERRVDGETEPLIVAGRFEIGCSILNTLAMRRRVPI